MALDRINLLLLPYAGGGARIFRKWKVGLPTWLHPIPLNLPGRGPRHGEPPIREWPALTALLSDEARPYLDRPFALFGHSLGALIALELAHEFRERYGKNAVWLGVSGCIAPVRRRPEHKWLHCSEEEFLAEVRSLNGTPPELLENRDLLDLIMPVLRADFHLAGSYQPRTRARLAMPMLIAGGTRDKEVSVTPENLFAWGKETTGPCCVKMIDAGHFFIDTHRDELIAAVVAGLSKVRVTMERADA